ncbi:MAG TPA: hypothetical protein VNN17_05150, partial [Terriglobia bacterium]|nr:hypothetical protein [Terriglobia bacterium]
MRINPVHFRRTIARFALAVACAALGSSAPLLAESVEGSVRNGTTNQPAAGVPVQFIKLQQGMTPVAETITDARGAFRFDEVEKLTGGSPALLQAVYQGATYSQPLLAPQTMAGGVQLVVYDATRDRGALALKEHAIFLRPAGGRLAVIEQIAIENNSNPPRTYVNPEGTYLYHLPGEPREAVQASVEGAAGMAVPQSPVPLAGANNFAITYPIRPGESQVRLQYALDYESPFRFTKRLTQPAEQTHIVTPGTGVEVRGEALTFLGKEPTTGFAAYLVAPGTGEISLQISGEAPATQTPSQSANTAESRGLVTIPDGATDRR